MIRNALLAVLFLLSTTLPAAAQADPTSRSWNQPVEPFRIADNLYYVGANEITSFLVTTPEGHILIDAGFVETAPIIRDSIRKLGFKLEDVKFLVNSQAHFDHAGGFAALREWTGAKLLASEADAAQLARGGKGDPVLGDSMPFPPVQADRIVRDGEAVTLGGVRLVPRLTPGHTRGCTTWTLETRDGDRKLDAVFVCSLSILPGTVLTGDKPSYPGIAQDFETSIRTLRALPCDLFLGSHGSFIALEDKAARLRRKESPNPFIDPDGYRRYLDAAEKTLRQRLSEERQPPPRPGAR